MTIPRDPNRKPPPMHPGEILREEFMVPMGVTNEELAASLGVRVDTVRNLTEERSGLDEDLALRLAKHYKMSQGFWMNLKNHYDREVAEDAFGPQIPY